MVSVKSGEICVLVDLKANRNMPDTLAIRGLRGFTGDYRKGTWSRQQESDLYLALRRHSFYPLNYGEDWNRNAQSAYFKSSAHTISYQTR